MASAIVEATTHFKDPELLAKVSRGLGNPMSGTAVGDLEEKQKIAGRGW
jgi:pyridoxal 5'-phosphate synthase pdxS subunit